MLFGNAPKHITMPHSCNSPTKFAQFRCWASILTSRIFKKCRNMCLCHTVHLDPQNSGCIRCAMQIIQSAHMVYSSLASYQKADLSKTRNDSDLHAYGRHGWGCPASCSCTAGNGTWTSSPPGKDYKQSRQQALKRQELFFIWHMSGPGNGKGMKRRKSSSISLQMLQQKLCWVTGKV